MSLARLSIILLLLNAANCVVQAQPDRISAMTKTPGFAALWDFAKRTADGRFDAYVPRDETHDLS
jgi:hypothetical protein